MKELKQVWRDFIGTEPPSISTQLLRLHLANRSQEIAEGGLSLRTKQKLRHLQAELGDAWLRFETVSSGLPEGTRLIREWHGQTHEVLVTADGLAFEGKIFSSLTAIAREITGTHWPGPRFFGIRGAGSTRTEPARGNFA